MTDTTTTTTDTNPADFAPALGSSASQTAVSVSSAAPGVQDIQNNGTTVDASPRTKLNFIPGSGISLSFSDDSTNDRVSVTTTNSMLTTVTTAGDLLVGTGSAAVKRLGLGTANQLLAVNGGATDITWANSNEFEMDYVQKTTNTTISASTEGTATTVITGTSQAYAAVAHMVHFYCPEVDITTTASVTFVLLRGSTVIGQHFMQPGTTSSIGVYVSARDTPSASTFSYVAKVFSSTGAGTVVGGTGGSGTKMPAFLRVVRV